MSDVKYFVDDPFDQAVVFLLAITSCLLYINRKMCILYIVKFACRQASFCYTRTALSNAFVINPKILCFVQLLSVNILVRQVRVDRCSLSVIGCCCCCTPLSCCVVRCYLLTVFVTMHSCLQLS